MLSRISWWAEQPRNVAALCSLRCKSRGMSTLVRKLSIKHLESRIDSNRSICRTNCRYHSQKCAANTVGPLVAFHELRVHQKCRNAIWGYAPLAVSGTTAGYRVAVAYV